MPTMDPLLCVFLSYSYYNMYSFIYLANPPLSVSNRACEVLSVMWIQISLLSFKY
jgi:hypothetical protein